MILLLSMLLSMLSYLMLVLVWKLLMLCFYNFTADAAAATDVDAADAAGIPAASRNSTSPLASPLPPRALVLLPASVKSNLVCPDS